MNIPQLSAPEAERRIKAHEAVLIDIREPDEYAREHIAGAHHVPLSRLDEHDFSKQRGAVVFHCQSGNRTCINFDRLKQSGAADITVLEGGLNAWKAAGLPTVVDRRQPLPMQRQVMITAGSIIVTSLVLAYLVAPWFAGLAAFMGCGLMFAGVSGWCGLAKLLERMPWNMQA